MIHSIARDGRPGREDRMKDSVDRNGVDHEPPCTEPEPGCWPPAWLRVPESPTPDPRLADGQPRITAPPSVRERPQGQIAHGAPSPDSGGANAGSGRVNLAGAPGPACPRCKRPLDDKARCWKCSYRTCAGCAADTGSAFIELCVLCGNAHDQHESGTV